MNFWSVRIRNRQRRRRCSPSRLRRAVLETLRDRKAGPSRIEVEVVGDAVIRRRHAEYFRDAASTDVITVSFPRVFVPPPGEPHARITISADWGFEEALRRGISPHEEMMRYAVHGTLHHLGFEDGTPAQRKRMFRVQERIVRNLLKRPSPLPDFRRRRR